MFNPSWSPDLLVPPFLLIFWRDLRGILDSLYALGYAGALGWAYNDKDFPFQPYKATLRDFAGAHACETNVLSYRGAPPLPITPGAEGIHDLVRRGRIGEARAAAERFLATHPQAADVAALTGAHAHW